jgi:hypothetical protein
MLHSTRKTKVISWLIQELEKQITDFDPIHQDRQLLIFTCQDLVTCLEVMWKATDRSQVYMLFRQAAENRPIEVKAFLKVWVSHWLMKWRERVNIFQRMPKLCKRHLETLRIAKTLYKSMEKRFCFQKLKLLIIQKLVNQGEFCMVQLIAESLIIEEIAHKLNRNRGKKSMKKTLLNPAEMTQNLLAKIKTLSERKTPLIYVKISVDDWKN